MAENDYFPPKAEPEPPMAVRHAASTWEEDEPVFGGRPTPFLPSVLRRAGRTLLRSSAVWAVAIVLDVVWMVASTRRGTLAAVALVSVMLGVAAPVLALLGWGRRPGHRLSRRRVAAAAMALALASLILAASFRLVEEVMQSLAPAR